MHWTSSLQILLRRECHHYSRAPHLEKLYKSALFGAGAVRRCLRQTDRETEGSMATVWESVFTTGNPSHPAQWTLPQSYPQISCPRGGPGEQLCPGPPPSTNTTKPQSVVPTCTGHDLCHGTGDISRSRQRAAPLRPRKTPVSRIKLEVPFVKCVRWEQRFPWCRRTVATPTSVVFYQSKAVTVWDQRDLLIALAIFFFFITKYVTFDTGLPKMQSFSLLNTEHSSCISMLFTVKTWRHYLHLMCLFAALWFLKILFFIFVLVAFFFL